MSSIFIFAIFVLPVSIQAVGVIVSLPAIRPLSTQPVQTKTKAKPAVEKTAGVEIHTWKHEKEGYKLACYISATNPTNYFIRVLYNDVLMEAMEAVRFDGELTKSVTIQSTNTTVHIVRYLLTDRTCYTRFYTKSEDGKGFKKTEQECYFPSSLVSLPRTIFRKNGWIWGQAKWENWGTSKRGFWGGAIEELPPTDAKPDGGLTEALKLHSWTNVVPGYSMTVYRVTKDHQINHYIAMYHHFELLQSGVKITKFDDTLLNSVSVAEPSGYQKDHHQIRYSFSTGNCVDRLYAYVQEKVTSTTAELQVSEGSCDKFTTFKILTYVYNTDAINGWIY